MTWKTLHCIVYINQLAFYCTFHLTEEKEKENKTLLFEKENKTLLFEKDLLHNLIKQRKLGPG